MITSTQRGTACPGCGLHMPGDERVGYDGYYNASAECWQIYTEVLGREFGDASIFGRAHQLTVDAYAVQHAGGGHPDKSVVIHLCGLHLVLDEGVAPTTVPRLFQRVAGRVETWPHYNPPNCSWSNTVFDVALAETPNDHVAAVHLWAEDVWCAWAAHHEAIRGFVGDWL